MEIRARLNQVHLAPRKVRAVVNVIKKKDVLIAKDQLAHMVKRPAHQIAKLLDSAITNAEYGYQMVPSNLYVKNVIVDEGTKLKRYFPRAQGRATEIQKKTSRILIVLDERVAGLKQEVKAKKKEEVIPVRGAATEATSTEKKPEIKKELGKKSGLFGNLRRKLFQRKSV
ncbi:MAG: 50S ribosomal protein L22 [Patescibacteria group bacterium]